jgi:hypothetical protein
MKHSHIPLLILAVSVTLVVAGMYVYMYNTTGTAIVRASLARDAMVTEQHDQLQSRAIFDLASSTAADRSRLSSFFISPDDIVSFITLLESLGTQAGNKVSITSIDADNMTNAAPGTVGHAHARIDTRGSWTQVMTVLSLAENLPYISTLNHVRLNANDVGGKQAYWSLSFDVQVSLLAPPVTSSTP